MPRIAKKKPEPNITLVAEWSLPPAATLGSSVRAKGILLEIRARLPVKLRKCLDVRGSELVLGMEEGAEADFAAVSVSVEKALVGIESLEVIPREIEDILTIKTSERHRWLKDGRLPSAGTRTVKLRGRARKITFHIFDPRMVEDLLNSDRVETWREEDAETKAENRRRALWKAKLKREAKKNATVPPESGRDEATGQKLRGWDEFASEFL
ncbi:hypothetical protein SAMN06295905_0100 [Devosia lucknowensis]|uniref:Uncharacterized protein n=1 Tax=Devosia lucknowensis TaxID=1096929 RepID=A0A1Y6E786_9HYPH|nr:hypothetical protein [Devosia lucknowensis]SMQ58564.1 hypothetical protein SAMN06295905_0100 [Devosia lucknowensis]